MSKRKQSTSNGKPPWAFLYVFWRPVPSEPLGSSFARASHKMGLTLLLVAVAPVVTMAAERTTRIVICTPPGFSNTDVETATVSRDRRRVAVAARELVDAFSTGRLIEAR